MCADWVSGSYLIPGLSYASPAGSGGFFLFKYVPGDFQMVVHLNGFTKAAYNMPDLLAPTYAATNAVLGQPLGYEVPGFNGTNNTGGYWVSPVRFDHLGIGTYARLNTDGTTTVSWPADVNSELQSSPSLDNPNWQRVGGTAVSGNDGRFRLSVPTAGDGKYFRLRN